MKTTFMVRTLLEKKNISTQLRQILSSLQLKMNVDLTSLSIKKKLNKSSKNKHFGWDSTIVWPT